MAIETGADDKTTQLTWHSILSILQKFLNDALNLPKVNKV